MLLPIITAPSPILKKKAQSVGEVNQDVQKLLDNMIETMFHGNGIGLAAPQVGESYRVFVMGDAQSKTKYKFINPEILWSSDEMSTYKEGCLSFPGQWLEIKRPETVKIRYIDEYNKVQEKQFSGLASRCIQHEIDHLDGKLFIDSLSKTKQRLIIERSVRFKK